MPARRVGIDLLRLIVRCVTNFGLTKIWGLVSIYKGRLNASGLPVDDICYGGGIVVRYKYVSLVQVRVIQSRSGILQYLRVINQSM